jgi:hypothetical protein
MAPKPPKPEDRPSLPRIRRNKGSPAQKAAADDLRTLRELSRHLPDRLEVYNIIGDLDRPIEKPSRLDRYSALVGGSLLEHALKTAIIKHLTARLSDKAYDEMIYMMFDDYERSPFATFAARIKAAYALGIIDDATRQNLEILKNVRNYFAHSVVEFEFSTPECAKELDKLTIHQAHLSDLWPKWTPRQKWFSLLFTYYNGIAQYDTSRSPLSFL